MVHHRPFLQLHPVHRQVIRVIIHLYCPVDLLHLHRHHLRQVESNSFHSHVSSQFFRVTGFIPPPPPPGPVGLSIGKSVVH